MSFRGVKSYLLACSSAAVLLAAVADANAGGFALREQSAYGQGSSFAGVAAGGSLSSMFWNPATMTQMPGIQFESVGTGIAPYATHNVGTPSTLAAFGGAGDSGDDAFVPASYASWQLNPNMWLGLSFNAPYGLSVSFPDVWAGRGYAEQTSLKTYNATPSFAYRINDWISLGVGMQIQYARADLTTGIGATPGLQATLSGHGWAYGMTAGVTVTPTPTTTIGVGYRSAMNQKIDGTLSLTGTVPGTTPGDVNTTLNLPDMISAGLRQRLDAQWTLLGTVEWSNWSRIGTSDVYQASGAAATIAGSAMKLPFQYSDGWFYSVGAEYQWSERLALRSGIGYEKSPITDQVRTPRLPDNDRVWLSAGLTYQATKSVSVDLAYSHLFVMSTPISISATSGNPWFNGVTYNGSVDSHVDIISAALKYRWDEPAPAPTKVGYFKAK